MNKKISFALLTLCIAAVQDMMLSSCSNAQQVDSKDGCYYYCGTNGKALTADANESSLAYTIASKNLMILFQQRQWDETGNQSAHVTVMTWQKVGDQIVARALAVGQTQRLGGEFQFNDLPDGYPMALSVWRNAENIQDAAYETVLYAVTPKGQPTDKIDKSMRAGNMAYALLPADDHLATAEAIINSPQFAALKEFIDSYDPSTASVPQVDLNDAKQEATAAPTASRFVLTEKGISGAVSLGDPLSKIPQQVEGLFDACKKEVENNEGDEYTQLEFTLKGKPVFTAMSYDGSTVEYIYLESDAIKFEADGTGYGIGSSINALRQKSGFKASEAEVGFPYEYNDIALDADDSGKITTIAVGAGPW